MKEMKQRTGQCACSGARLKIFRGILWIRRPKITDLTPRFLRVLISFSHKLAIVSFFHRFRRSESGVERIRNRGTRRWTHHEQEGAADSEKSVHLYISRGGSLWETKTLDWWLSTRERHIYTTVLQLCVQSREALRSHCEIAGRDIIALYVTILIKIR